MEELMERSRGVEDEKEKKTYIGQELLHNVKLVMPVLLLLLEPHIISGLTYISSISHPNYIRSHIHLVHISPE